MTISTSEPARMDERVQLVAVLSGILGNRTISNGLLASLDRIGMRRAEVWVSPDDYHEFRAPWVLRRISLLEGRYVAGRKLARLGAKDPPVILINGHELASAVRARFPDSRLIVALDATPSMVAALHRLGGASRARRLVKIPVRSVLEIQFRHLAKHVSKWLPISNWCRDSLVRDYGVDAENCWVTRSPQESIAERPSTPGDECLKLLFVGNDFFRKGGAALLEAMRRQPAGIKLTIVSNDKSIIATALPDSVRLLRGIDSQEQLVPIYQSHHLQVLPTLYDAYPNVVCEGLAQGLPFLATRLPGILELIDESGAGWGLPCIPGVDDLCAEFDRFRQSFRLLHEARVQAVCFAKRCLSASLLDKALQEVLSGDAGQLPMRQIPSAAPPARSGAARPAR